MITLIESEISYDKTAPLGPPQAPTVDYTYFSVANIIQGVLIAEPSYPDTGGMINVWRQPLGEDPSIVATQPLIDPLLLPAGLFGGLDAFPDDTFWVVQTGGGVQFVGDSPQSTPFVVPS